MTTFESRQIESIAGPRAIRVPVGFDWNVTAKHVWIGLVDATEKGRQYSAGQVLAKVYRGQCDALARVLANSLGMAGFFWEQAAREILDQGGAWK